MNCARYHHLLSRYVDGEVTPRQRSELLAHVEGCAECAAWLARARQTDVLLKGAAPATRPSDRVRATILDAVRGESVARSPMSRLGRLRVAASALLLRLDPSPRHIAVALVAFTAMLAGGAYWFNMLPWSGYSQLGFLVSSDDPAVRVNSTPLAAISRGEYGVGGPVAVPNPVRLAPVDGAQNVDLGVTLGARFDQPMDRRSVERGLNVEPPLSGSFDWGADNEVRFTPDQPMLLGVTYTVTLTGTARSLHGIPIEAPLNWSFRTRDPLGLMIEPPAGATLAPTATLSLRFEAPMVQDEAQIALRLASTGDDIPATQAWDAQGENLTVTPIGPLTVGEDVQLWVGAETRAQAGDKLGQAYEASYRVRAQAAHLHLAGERVRVISRGEPALLQYEAMLDASGAPPQSVTLDIYALPVERLAALGAQAAERTWPAPLPSDARAGLERMQTLHQTYREMAAGANTVRVPALTPGAYLVFASAPSAHGQLNDWQIVLVSGGGLALADGDRLWATDGDGRAWVEGEALLFAPDGALLRSGIVGESGLWEPEGGATGATLGIVRDAQGRFAATVWNPAVASPHTPNGTLDATLRTDRPVYSPGQAANFSVLWRLPTPVPAAALPPTDGATATPATRSDLLISLLHPNGATLATLDLSPNETGRANGAFTLSPGAATGDYTVRVQADGAYRDFSLRVEDAAPDTLSVFIVPPSTPDAEVAESITRTVSVLGPEGDAVTGALVTGTLGITGDAWVSTPVTATSDGAGRATIALPLPAWAVTQGDPALFFRAEAGSGERAGSHAHYLDTSTTETVQPGITRMVSPMMDLHADIHPTDDGGMELQLSPLTADGASRGDALVLAEDPSGETARWIVDLSPESAAAPIAIPAAFRGGRLLIMRAGVAGGREIELLPPASAQLSLKTAYSVQPSAPLTVSLTLADADGSSSAGTAAVWFRRVGGPSPLPEPYSWNPGIELVSTGQITATVTAPGAPGLWYVFSEAAGVDGDRALTWTVVRVLPGPTIQLPPSQQESVSEEGRLALVVHNPGSVALSSGLRAEGGSALRVLGGGSQAVDVAAAGWRRTEWRYVHQAAGSAPLTFSFMPSAGVGGGWSLDIASRDSDRANVTHVAGATGEAKQVGVQVPSGLAADRVRLEIRASTSLLPTLASIATDPSGSGAGSIEGVMRFGSVASVVSAYATLVTPSPDTLTIDAPLRAFLLDTLYTSQQRDGGWTANPSADRSDLATTAGVLLSLKREALANGNRGDTANVQPDAQVVARGLGFLRREVARPAETSQRALDARAYAMYTLALYGELQAGTPRPYMRYAASGLGDVGLSSSGRAWLALALHHTGDHSGEGALLDRLLAESAQINHQAAAPLLDLVLLANETTTDGNPHPGIDGRDVEEYDALAQALTLILMEGRRGAGWGDPTADADALWSLSRYAVHQGEKPRAGAPGIELNGRVVASSPGEERGTLQLAISGDALHPGTNWLALRPSSPGQTLYYSLTLRAMR